MEIERKRKPLLAASTGMRGAQGVDDPGLRTLLSTVQENLYALTGQLNDLAGQVNEIEQRLALLDTDVRKPEVIESQQGNPDSGPSGVIPGWHGRVRVDLSGRVVEGDVQFEDLTGEVFPACPESDEEMRTIWKYGMPWTAGPGDVVWYPGRFSNVVGEPGTGDDD